MAIVGWPVEHSLSPTLWRGMARRKVLALQYTRHAVPPDDERAWRDVWDGDLDALNVTTPHKARAAADCPRLAPEAARIDAVNTVVRDADGTWVGHSTDGYGVVQALREAGSDVADRRVVVLGTGGAGRAAAVAVAAAGGRVTLVSRRPDRRPAGCGGCAIVGWDGLAAVSPAPEILVNATPLGRREADPLPPLPYDRWCDGAVALDLNYVPRRTAFLVAVERAGADPIGGVSVLVHQACAGAAIVFDGTSDTAADYATAFWAAESASRDPARSASC